jgi:hypothetical protein
VVEEEEDEVVWPHPGVWMVQLVENRLPVAGVKTSPLYIFVNINFSLLLHQGNWMTTYADYVGNSVVEPKEP